MDRAIGLAFLCRGGGGWRPRQTCINHFAVLRISATDVIDPRTEILHQSDCMGKLFFVNPNAIDIEPEQQGFSFMTEENTERVKRQKKAPIFVVIGTPLYNSKQLAQIIIERWRVEYNTLRPHSSLGYRPPAPAAIVPATIKATDKEMGCGNMETAARFPHFHTPDGGDGESTNPSTALH